jgi:hypothetical protein
MSGCVRKPVHNRTSHHSVFTPIKIIANDRTAGSGNLRQFFNAIPDKTIKGNITV